MSLRVLRLLDRRELREQREVLRARLVEHELAQRALGAVEGLRLRDLVLAQRLDRVLLDRLNVGIITKMRQEERDADQHLVRRRGRRAEARADEAEDDQDAREAGDREQQRRHERDPADQEQDLQRVAAVRPSLDHRPGAQLVEPVAARAGPGRGASEAAGAGVGVVVRRRRRQQAQLERPRPPCRCGRARRRARRRRRRTTSLPARTRCSERSVASGRLASGCRPAPAGAALARGLHLAQHPRDAVDDADHDRQADDRADQRRRAAAGVVGRRRGRGCP